jgi:hypothetical protein
MCRLCPGKNLGENSIFIMIASMLAAFTISKELDEYGKEIEPNPTFTSGIVRCVLLSSKDPTVH